MPKITYIAFDGTRTEIKADPGTNLMQLALDNNIRGIDGDCGGNCACATCHIYVEEALSAQHVELDEMEDAMLDMTAMRKANSRLGCQIEVTEEMDGMVVHMPEAQN